MQLAHMIAARYHILDKKVIKFKKFSRINNICSYLILVCYHIFEKKFSKQK